MTYVFDPVAERALVQTQMLEWDERYPVPGENSRLALEIVGAWQSGNRRTLPEEMPRLLIAERPRKSWPDTFWTIGGLMVVRAPVRDIIEALDPGVHQFFPLRIRTKRGVEIEGPWFSMVVSVKQNSVVMELSDVFVHPRVPERLCSFSGTTDVTVDPARQSGLNLWRETRFKNSLLGSDQLVADLKAAGLKFFPGFQAKDLPPCAKQGV